MPMTILPARRPNPPPPADALALSGAHCNSSPLSFSLSPLPSHPHVPVPSARPIQQTARLSPSPLPRTSLQFPYRLHN